MVPGPGQLNPLPSEHPSPAAQLIEHLTAVETIGRAGTIGEGGGETGLWSVSGM